jgi:eukaryotic-like serine/threonine-protein kinase
MIAFSCRHCGQRMKITEADGSKKATCPKCGQVVLIPTGDTTLRPGRKAGRAPTESNPGEPTVIIAPPPGVRLPRQDTTPVPKQPIHELPTRTGAAPAAPLADLVGFLAPAQADDELGRLGPYRVLEVLGSGGMGVVFLAEDPRLRRRVALKAMLPALAASASARERFLREARAVAAIQHDRVVTIYAVDEAHYQGVGIPYLAMPYLKGEPLEARIRREAPLPAAEVLRLGREIAEGLSAIHEHGLIHRDIKPGNVWLETMVGGGYRVKILDFGLARAARGEEQLTQAGTIVGSPAFMAPEQASRMPVDARCDLFSLGVVLYLLCTGELPFEGDDALTTLLAVTTFTPPTPQQRNPAMPAAVSELVMQLLAKKPDERPASASVVLARLQEIEKTLGY